MSLLWGRRLTEEVEEELAFHREMLFQQYLTRGFTEAAARLAADQRFGDYSASRSACLVIDQRRTRKMQRARTLDALKQDLRFAFRTLTRRPGWTLVAMLTLALGVGATTAVYSVVNALLLNPIPYPEAERVVMVMAEFGKASGIMMSPSAATVEVWQANPRGLEAMEAFQPLKRTLRLPEHDPAIVDVTAIQSTFDDFVGKKPLLGRAFSREDEVPGAAPVIMIGEGTWYRRFGGSRNVLGQLVTLDEVTYQVVGVLPTVGVLPKQTINPEFWVPLKLKAPGTMPMTMARLAPGAELAAVERELDALQGLSPTALKDLTTKLVRPAELVGITDTLRMLSLAVMLVLLIACANVAHLFLARGAARERELAIRASLGAGRARIFRQLLTESLLLTVSGSVAGLSVGWLTLQVMIRWRPPTLDELANVRFNGPVVISALLLALLTGIIFGVMGLLQLRRRATQESLRSSSLSASATRGQRRLRGALLVTEMALSATLLVGTSLLVRSIMHLQSTNPGFNASGLYAVSFTFPESATAAQQELFLQQLATRSSGMPGLEAVTIAENIPPEIGMMFGTMHVEGEPETPGRSALLYNTVMTDYFDVIGMSFLAGSVFTDTTSASNQVIINEGMAQAHWKDASAIGRRLQMSKDGPWMTVVGVVGNISAHGLMGDRTTPMIYTPRAPTEGGQGGALMVRMQGDRSPTDGIRALAKEIDPRLPPAEVLNVAEEMERTIARPQFATRLLLSFTVLALVLAAVGLYGVMAYTVTQRTREIGIRMALGASRKQILTAVLGYGLVLTLTGIGAGLVGAIWASQLLSGLLFGVSKGDPLSYVVGGLVLVFAAMTACLVPARRALRVDPVVAIRTE